MQLSPHFSLAELTVSARAKREGINNTPTGQDLDNLRRLAATLEDVRTLLGNRPIIVTSAYRSPALNAATPNASKTSAHRLGLAADFTCPQFGTVTQVARAIANSGVVFDQLIHEYGTWVHLGLSVGKPRRQLLQIREGTGYLPGLPA